MELTLLFAFPAWLILSLLMATAGHKRGHNGPLLFFVGLILSPLAAFMWIVAAGTNQAELLNRDVRDGKRRRCPYCAEYVWIEAVGCPHCETEFVETANESVAGVSAAEI